MKGYHINNSRGIEKPHKRKMVDMKVIYFCAVYIGGPTAAFLITHTHTLVTLVPAQSGARPRWLRFSITGIRRALQHKVIVAGCHAAAWCRKQGAGGRAVSRGLNRQKRNSGRSARQSPLGVLSPSETHTHTLSCSP
jgi:hypothetical protein